MRRTDVPSSEVLYACEEPLDYSGLHELADTQTIDIRHLIDELDLSADARFREVEGTVFGKLLKSIPIPILLLDRSYTIVFANPYWEKISENYVSLLNRPFSSIFPKKSVARAADSIVERGFNTRKPLVASAVIEVDESRIWGRMHFRSLRNGNETALIVLVEDLTSEKRQLIMTERHKEALVKARMELEERVKERTADLSASRASFTSIVEKTSEGILVVDSSNMVLYANPAAASLLGLSREQLVGQHLSLKLLPGQTTEVKGKRFTGESGILELRVESTDWNEKPAKLLMLRDITERKRAEQEMLKTEKLHSLELVAGGIAHDFNNLLTGIMANVSLARMEAPRKSVQREALKNAEKAASGAKHLTHQLLTFTRGGEPVKKPCYVDRIIKDGMALALSGSKIKSEICLEGDLWAAEIDQQQVGHALQNLFINAVQAMPAGGCLKVTAENVSADAPVGRCGNYLRICVGDTGCGIAPEHLGKIFDPYFTTKPKGSGIGLATAHSVIRRHGGIIDVTSEVNIGTTFIVYLPAILECEIEPPLLDSGEGPSMGTGRILVMDDDDAIRTVVEDLLTVLGYDVTEARDGTECIDLYKQAMEEGRPYSVVLMDLTVPGGMGGKAAIAQLLELDPYVKAIVSSGYSNDPVMSDYRSYGFQGIVAKPYNAEELSRALKKLL